MGELLTEFVRHLLACCFVFRIHFVTEGLLLPIKDGSEIIGRLIAQQLEDRIDEAEKGARVESVGSDERIPDHGEVRSVHHGISVDEEQPLLV